MTSPEDGLEEALRHALHAALNQVEPGADGLERIRARTRGHKPAPWLVAVAAGAAGRARHWVWHGHWSWPDPFRRLTSLPLPRLRLLQQGSGHVPAHATTGHKPRRSAGVVWLRPAAVLAGVVFLASVALAIPPFRQAIVQVSNTVLTGGQTLGGPQGSGGGSAAGNGTLPGNGSPAGGAGPGGTKNAASPTATASCQPTAKASTAPTQYVSAPGTSNGNAVSTAAAGSGDLGASPMPTVLPPLSQSATACPSASATPSAHPTQSPSLSPSPTTGSMSPPPSTTPTQSSSPSQSPSQAPSQSPSQSPSPNVSSSVTPASTPSNFGTGSRARTGNGAAPGG